MERADNRARRVLVIDDDHATLALYRAILEDEGHCVFVASSPALAPSAIVDLAPDLLLLDLRFGHDERGTDLLARLKDDAATRSLPVLVCSADTRLLADLDDQLRAWNCGALVKPFDIDALLAAIQAGLDRDDRAARPSEAAEAM